MSGVNNILHPFLYLLLENRQRVFQMLASGVLVYLKADTCQCSGEITVPAYIRIYDYQVLNRANPFKLDRCKFL